MMQPLGKNNPLTIFGVYYCHKIVTIIFLGGGDYHTLRQVRKCVLGCKNIIRLASAKF
jgi:hypothetical protein